ncbi:MAG: Fe-S cluster assembly protein SufD [Firmicutes bacterium]|nr:Fe-S cluster assembly protein SufD [Bacillota bacterium]
MRANHERLTELRAEALKAFQALPDPDWYDTSVWPRVQLVDPTPKLACETRSQSLASGVICQDLFSSSANDSELVKRFLGSVVKPATDRLVALHYVNMNSGCLVYVPPHTEADVVLTVDRTRDDSDEGSFHHTMVIADTGARLRLLQTDESPDTTLVVDVVEVIAQEGAYVEYSTWQDLGIDTCHYNVRRALLHRDASVDWLLGTFGARVSNEKTLSHLQGAGSQSSCLALFLGSDRQRYNLAVDMLHEGEHTASDILTRGVLDRDARTVYVGRATIGSSARHASAFQQQNTLLLSKNARVDTTPELLIGVDEVQAGHASTVGQIDQDQLFYLMSRGLPEQIATRMIIHGFLAPIVQRVPIQDEQTRLMELIDRKIAI